MWRRGGVDGGVDVDVFTAGGVGWVAFGGGVREASEGRFAAFAGGKRDVSELAGYQVWRRGL